MPRERFVPLESLSEACADRALPIDCDQTISQPYIVALMTEALELTGGESVLEIGTGSGYQTAVLAQLAGSVTSIERHPELSSLAGKVLEALACDEREVNRRQWCARLAAGAPYDRIIVTAAAAEIPRPLYEQLREGGILVIPLGGTESQTLTAVRKTTGKPTETALAACRFVPLIG